MLINEKSQVASVRQLPPRRPSTRLLDHVSPVMLCEVINKYGDMEQALEMEIQGLMREVMYLTAIPALGVPPDLMVLKLNYMGILEAVDLGEDSTAIFSLNKNISSARPLIRQFHDFTRNRTNTATAASKRELDSCSIGSNSLEAAVQLFNASEDVTRIEMILGLFLELTSSLLSVDPVLGLTTYECHARFYACLWSPANAYDEHHRVAVLASRVQDQERCIWHCNFILSRLNEANGADSGMSLKLVYHTIKVLVAQYCSTSNFDAAHDCLAWAMKYIKKIRETAVLNNPDNSPDVIMNQDMWIDDLQVSIARVHLLNGCPDECAEVIQDYLTSSPDIHNTSSRKEWRSVRVPWPCLPRLTWIWTTW